MPDIAATAAESPAEVLTVSALNRLARETLERTFPLCWVSGEVSNLTRAASGHLYFSLKDAAAQVRCVMFRNRAQLAGWRLENGQHVEARVLPTLYEARGDFQLNVEALRRTGVGSLYERFLKLKARLEAEGLFATEAKRPLPAFPRRIGIVTSLQAAALRDVLTTLRRRSPHVGIVLYPTQVQGDGAGAQIAAAIHAAGAHGACDLLIVCRGGGSIEDLWAFNEEVVARAIRGCPIPVISGVGHETDFTIADFAADCRAPTPTAAAEIASPDRGALLARLAELGTQLGRRFARGIGDRAQRVDGLARRLRHPAERIAQQRQAVAHLGWRLATARRQDDERRAARLAGLADRIDRARPQPAQALERLALLHGRLGLALRRRLDADAAALTRLGSNLGHLDPEAVMARGYGIVRDGEGRIVKDAGTLAAGETIAVQFHRGHATAEVRSVSPAKDNDGKMVV